MDNFTTSSQTKSQKGEVHTNSHPSPRSSLNIIAVGKGKQQFSSMGCDPGSHAFSGHFFLLFFPPSLSPSFLREKDYQVRWVREGVRTGRIWKTGKNIIKICYLKFSKNKFENCLYITFPAAPQGKLVYFKITPTPQDNASLSYSS